MPSCAGCSVYLGHVIHGSAPLGLGAGGGVEASFQHSTGVQVQGAKANLLLPKLLLNHLSLHTHVYCHVHNSLRQCCHAASCNEVACQHSQTHQFVWYDGVVSAATCCLAEQHHKQSTPVVCSKDYKHPAWYVSQEEPITAVQRNLCECRAVQAVAQHGCLTAPGW